MIRNWEPIDVDCFHLTCLTPPVQKHVDPSPLDFNPRFRFITHICIYIYVYIYNMYIYTYWAFYLLFCGVEKNDSYFGVTTKKDIYFQKPLIYLLFGGTCRFRLSRHTLLNGEDGSDAGHWWPKVGSQLAWIRTWRWWIHKDWRYFEHNLQNLDVT